MRFWPKLILLLVVIALLAFVGARLFSMVMGLLENLSTGGTVTVDPAVCRDGADAHAARVSPIRTMTMCRACARACMTMLFIAGRRRKISRRRACVSSGLI